MQIKICGSVVGVNEFNIMRNNWQIFKMFTLQPTQIFQAKKFSINSEIDFPV